MTPPTNYGKHGKPRAASLNNAVSRGLHALTRTLTSATAGFVLIGESTVNCNCISEKEKEVFESLHKHPKFSGKLESVRLANAGVAVTDGLNLKATISIPFCVKADVPGFRQKNGKELPFFANFCPFCGASTTSTNTKEAQ